MIAKLTVLYDAECGFCCRCAKWLLTQRRHVRIECLPNGSPYVQELFPGLRKLPKAELTVIDDQGGVYLGANAWLMSLWALTEYRTWARRLASPTLKPMAREAFELVSSNRRSLSTLLSLHTDASAAHALKMAVPDGGRCDEGTCGHPQHA
ncbi:MAG: thiol-disulfide oxidoreductase DCC family protein [Myxococcota bacterium]